MSVANPFFFFFFIFGDRKRGGFEEEQKEHVKWIKAKEKKILNCVRATLRLQGRKRDEVYTLYMACEIEKLVFFMKLYCESFAVRVR